MLIARHDHVMIKWQTVFRRFGGIFGKNHAKTFWWIIYQLPTRRPYGATNMSSLRDLAVFFLFLFFYQHVVPTGLSGNFFPNISHSRFLLTWKVSKHLPGFCQYLSDYLTGPGRFPKPSRSFPLSSRGTYAHIAARFPKKNLGRIF